MSKKLKKNLIRIIVSLVLFGVVFSVDLALGLDSIIENNQINWLLPLGLYLIIYFIIGYDVLFKAIKNIIRGQIFDENFLMCIATIGALNVKNAIFIILLKYIYVNLHVNDINPK